MVAFSIDTFPLVFMLRVLFAVLVLEAVSATTIECESGDIPANAYPIATMCALFDSTNIATISPISATDMLSCISQFAHAADDYGESMFDMFTSSPTSACALAILSFAESVATQRGDSALCGEAPAGTSAWELVVPDAISSQRFDCLFLLSTSVAPFFADNGFDFRNATINAPCPAVEFTTFEGSYSSMEVLRDCIVNEADYETFQACLDAEVTDSSSALYSFKTDYDALPCTRCYEQVFSKSKAVGYGTLFCTEESVYNQRCLIEQLADIGWYLDVFRVCSGGNLIAFSPESMCSDSDSLLNDALIPSTWVSLLDAEFIEEFGTFQWLEFAKVTGMQSFSQSSCRTCYEPFFNSISEMTRSAKMLELCGEGDDSIAVLTNSLTSSTYDDRIGACLDFLNEAGGPLAEFHKCARFPMVVATAETELPGCSDSDIVASADTLTVTDVVNCILAQEDTYTISDFLSSNALLNCADSLAGPSGITQGCVYCFSQAAVAIYDVLTGPAGFACTNPSSGVCQEALSMALTNFEDCSGMSLSGPSTKSAAASMSAAVAALGLLVTLL